MEGEKPLSGTVVDGRYAIEDELGRGGMGSVYRGTQIALSRRVAIKVLRAEMDHDGTNTERLIREAQALSTVRHPNIVEVIDFGKLDDGSPFIVMEFLHGKDLAVVLREEGRLPWSRARGILLQVIAGLRAAHKKGVLHRDVKPSNCFLVQEPDAEPGDYVKLVDFGIAKFVAPPVGHERRLTQAAFVVGTAKYLAPEVYDGGEASIASDIYAWGVLAYQMLTGQAPFVGRDAYDLQLQAKHDPPRPMQQLAPDVMPSVERVILRALAKTPNDRWRSTTDLEAAILEIDAAGRRRASGRTGTVMPGAIGLTGEQPIIVEASASGNAMQREETAPHLPRAGRSERAPTPWDHASASASASTASHPRATSSIVTPIFVSVTIGAIAGAAFLVYARWGEPGRAPPRAESTAESEPTRTDAETDPPAGDHAVEAELVDRVRRRCAEVAGSGSDSIELRLTVTSEGAIETFAITRPHDATALRSCIDDIVADAKFPAGEERQKTVLVPL